MALYECGVVLASVDGNGRSKSHKCSGNTQLDGGVREYGELEAEQPERVGRWFQPTEPCQRHLTTGSAQETLDGKL